VDVGPAEPIGPIEPIRRTRVPEEIANRIRALILDGTFKPGQPLPSERTLAARLGVSRGSVRDGIRRLEILGLLQARHGLGTFPRELSVESLVTPLASVLTINQARQDDLMDVRRIFEPAVASAAAVRVTAAELAELTHIVASQRQKVRAGQATIDEDTAFHSALARATHNLVMVSIMKTLNDLLVESRTLTLRQPGRPLRSLRGHEAVLQAIRRRDANGAALAMRGHIDQITGLLRQFHAEAPSP
jgi:GntR family transcriptional repressor for pyruvate dehydrogenase complex